MSLSARASEWGNSYQVASLTLWSGRGKVSEFKKGTSDDSLDGGGGVGDDDDDSDDGD